MSCLINSAINSLTICGFALPFEARITCPTGWCSASGGAKECRCASSSTMNSVPAYYRIVGTVTMTTTSQKETPRNCMMRKAAAPISGGERTAPMPPVAISPAAMSGE